MSELPPDGKTAVAWGEPIGQTASLTRLLRDRSLLRVDQAVEHSRSGRSGWRQELRGSLDGKSVLTFVHSGALTRIFRFPVSGAEALTQLLTATGTVWFLEAGPGDSFYANNGGPSGGRGPVCAGRNRQERLATFPQTPDLTTMTVLPDGRPSFPFAPPPASG